MLQPVMKTHEQVVGAARRKAAVKPSAPNLYLRLEGLVLFAGAVLLFAAQHGNGWMFALLLLAPDLSALGYLVNTRVGAATYNLAHNYLLPGILLLIGVSAANPLVIQLAAIWFAHIGMDRAAGYGLKYAAAFKDTHLQRV